MRTCHPITLSPHRLIDLSLTSVAGVAVIAGSSFLMAVHAPLHIVSINHFDRSLLHACQTVADGTVHPLLDMNPVREGDIFREFVHPVPWNLPICLHIFDHFQRFRPFTHGIRCMASSAEFDVGNACSAIPFNIPMAERTV